VLADPAQIGQVIVNLALNARDAMPAGGSLTIETANVQLGPGSIGLEPQSADGPHVLLAVSDTGNGMSAETKARVFEPFFTTKGVGKGTGLGLSTVYGIVHQSGGHVQVYSEIGIGTTFKVYLPARASEDCEFEESRSIDTSTSRGSESVLLAEDEEGVRNLVRDLLKLYGYEVIEARNGEEAIELAKRRTEPIDILVTDVVMPGMSGRQLADRLGRIRPGMRVLFMSGYADEAIVQHGVLEAGTELIQKPFAPEKLVERVRQALDRREAA
jgi:CheY-like chemotaxis protein